MSSSLATVRPRVGTSLGAHPISPFARTLSGTPQGVPATATQQMGIFQRSPLPPIARPALPPYLRVIEGGRGQPDPAGDPGDESGGGGNPWRPWLIAAGTVILGAAVLLALILIASSGDGNNDCDEKKGLDDLPQQQPSPSRVESGPVCKDTVAVAGEAIKRYAGITGAGGRLALAGIVASFLTLAGDQAPAREQPSPLPLDDPQAGVFRTSLPAYVSLYQWYLLHSSDGEVPGVISETESHWLFTIAARSVYTDKKGEEQPNNPAIQYFYTQVVTGGVYVSRYAGDRAGSNLCENWGTSDKYLPCDDDSFEYPEARKEKDEPFAQMEVPANPVLKWGDDPANHQARVLAARQWPVNSHIPQVLANEGVDAALKDMAPDQRAQMAVAALSKDGRDFPSEFRVIEQHIGVTEFVSHLMRRMFNYQAMDGWSALAIGHKLLSLVAFSKAIDKKTKIYYERKVISPLVTRFLKHSNPTIQAVMQDYYQQMLYHDVTEAPEQSSGSKKTIGGFYNAIQTDSEIVWDHILGLGAYGEWVGGTIGAISAFNLLMVSERRKLVDRLVNRSVRQWAKDLVDDYSKNQDPDIVDQRVNELSEELCASEETAGSRTRRLGKNTWTQIKAMLLSVPAFIGGHALEVLLVSRPHNTVEEIPLLMPQPEEKK